MTLSLQTCIDQLGLTVLNSPKDFERVAPAGVYASDLLSCVLAGARRQELWVTLQAHANIVAVAAMVELCAVVLTEGASPDAETVARANAEGIPLLGTAQTTAEVVGRLWALGLRRG
jgi:hypothetical protein